MQTLTKIIEQSWQKPNLISYCLLPLSWLYGAIHYLRKAFVKLGLIKQYKAPVPVIVVGNISVGGTGKTPLVIYLIEQLTQQGYKIGVISRGYGGKATQYPLSVKTTTSPIECGDEPALIVKRTGVPMVVGANRKQSIERLLEECDCDLIISDDGLQHLKLHADIQLCLTDKTNPSINRFLLPAGPYREPQGRLKSVDFVINHRQTNLADNDETSMWLKAEQPKLLVESNSDVTLAPQKVHAVAGIGNPVRFFNTCIQLGFELRQHVFQDHYQYQASDLKFDDALPILMTEKDAIKCTQFAGDNCWYLPVNAQLSEGFMNALVQKLEAVKKEK